MSLMDATRLVPICRIEIQNESNQSYITEAGDVEKWTGSSKNKLLETKEEGLKYLDGLKKE